MSDRWRARIGTVCAPWPQGASPSPRETVEDLPCSPELSFQNRDFKSKVQASHGLRSCSDPRWIGNNRKIRVANALVRWLPVPNRPLRPPTPRWACRLARLYALLCRSAPARRCTPGSNPSIGPTVCARGPRTSCPLRSRDRLRPVRRRRESVLRLHVARHLRRWTHPRLPAPGDACA
jgi:hypothetical protein